MPVGKVKWFNEIKGYGFLSERDSRNVFVHYSCISGEGFRTLDEGEEVVFDITVGPKGLHAVNVSREI
ncbi:MAG TPA: cold shock domain-containing protein [Anaerolineae bacterium]|nr:cold shock domain-containing protein [Anaerolineae bacterium]